LQAGEFFLDHAGRTCIKLPPVRERGDPVNSMVVKSGHVYWTGADTLVMKMRAKGYEAVTRMARGMGR
jgi:hypothetical protein